jgi:chorismate mutase/prephenate dehydratase
MDLDEWRSRINDLDDQILTLLNRRAEAALRIGELKRQQGFDYFAPEREAEILSRLQTLNPGPFPSEGVTAVWREILSASLALEAPLAVAYLGPRATFTHQAAALRFGSSARFISARSIVDVFEEVERGRADFGVVPVENSTEGAVNVTLDRLIDSDLLIAGELFLEISHDLISLAGELSAVKAVHSHPQALAQCRQWLGSHLPEVPTIEVPSTAAAAEYVLEDPTAAAVASEWAARLYGVSILKARIEDNPNNSTRFLIVGRRSMNPTGKDKTSILFSMKNEPGTLHRILEPFAERRLNLTKIESRPTKRRPWEYLIFVDFEGHRDTEQVQTVLSQVRERCIFLKVLGSYPAA